jgi:beta-lactamase class C
MKPPLTLYSTALLLFCALRPAAKGIDADISAAVNEAIPPLMKQWGIPGMEVGVALNGHERVLTFGVSSLATRQPVAPDTIFEIGSITKTFTAALAAYAQEKGALSLSDPVERYLPELRDTPFGAVKLVNLGTQTPGGLPLQVPNSIQTMEQMFAYLRAWKPSGAPGTIRTYTNVGTGAFGLIAARSLKRDFEALFEDELLPGLGLHHSYLRVPVDRQGAYAQGYTSSGQPVRQNIAVFSQETYGVRTTAGDLLTFLDENMEIVPIGNPQLTQALRATHTGYYRAGPLTQDLIWGQYPMPVTLETLLQGNSIETSNDPTPTTALVPPLSPRSDAWINKTGSTLGFGAYVAFIPKERLGIVLLANKYYPIPERVKVAYAILSSICHRQESGHQFEDTP